MIIAQPNYTYNSAYLPVLWQSFVFFTDMAYAKVTVQLTGAAGSEELLFAPQFEAFGATYFLFDIQRTLQLKMGTPQRLKSAVFPRFNTAPASFGYTAAAVECYISTFLDIEYYQYQNGLPVLVDQDTTNQADILLGVRQIEEDDSFAEYITAPASDAKFLTRRSHERPTNITRNQSLYLNYINNREITTFRLQGFDKNDNLIYSGVHPQLNTGALQQTWGVGLPQLATYIPGAFLSGSFDATDPNIKRYTVEVGNGDESGLNRFVPFTVAQQFNVVDGCKDALEVNWLNDLGGGESYVFRTETITEITGKGSFARQPLISDPNLPRPKHDRGRFKFNNTETLVQYKCKSDFLNKDEAEYIKSLLYTMELYQIKDFDFFSLQVEDTSFVEDDNNEFYTQLEITFTASIDKYSMIR